MTLTADRQRRSQQIFNEALDKAPEDRAAFVAQACGADAEVLAEVKSLLAHDGQAGEDFMWVPEGRPGHALGRGPGGPDSRINTSIGGYHIEGVIASGGMGTVYEAVQAEPHRTVALKVLHRHVASQNALRRFRFESQILAHLRHPNIAQVFAAGMHDEGSAQVPYFAMEYVPEARTIIDYAAEKKLGTRERLELFMQVCEAVHHGHQKGIIHRDLKPGNILVDSSGRPKIIDFGVARSTDSDIAMTTLQTDVGQMIGTLQYMSPEQCDADPHEIDTRCDVYSLGVVLYELLTGRLPYDVSHLTIHSGIRLICEEPAAKPSVFNRRLRGDVETIVLKALEKNREKRYQSAAELAGDMRRSLKGEPIDARPPTAWTRCVRWVARRPMKATVSACLSMAAIVIGATYIAVWFLNIRPYEIVRYRGGELVGNEDGLGLDEACLLARNRNTLYTWGGETSSLAFAGSVDRPDVWGGGRLAVIGYSQHEPGELRGSLCAYEIDGDFTTPKWSRRIETDEIMPQLHQNRGFVGGQFRIKRCLIADVFTDAAHPGKEIVAIFGLVFSQRVIRVYDLTGKRLYEAWHDGGIAQPYWMAGAKQLLFLGDDALANWDRFGNALNANPNPLVVFALRPEPDVFNNTGFLNDPDSLRLGRSQDRPGTMWYNYLYLGEAHVTRDVIKGGWRLEPHDTADPGWFVNLTFLLDKELGAGVNILIDSSGNDMPNELGLTDNYHHNQKLPDGDPTKLPDPRAFHLGPIPPIVSTSQPADAAPGEGVDGP